MNWYISGLKKYVQFEGRAGRSEFWMFVLMWWIVICVLGLTSIASQTLAMVVDGVYIVATFLPGLAVLVRRLHDTDRAGTFCFFALIPYLGAIAVAIVAAVPGTVGPNRYGPDPMSPTGR